MAQERRAKRVCIEIGRHPRHLAPGQLRVDWSISRVGTPGRSSYLSYTVWLTMSELQMDPIG